jgi:glycosyltransferase involved in cell wall biosynthesis
MGRSRQNDEPRVVHTVPALFGPGGVVGGAERYVLELARHMASQVPTTLLTFGAKPREERMGALRIRVLGPSIRVRSQEYNRFSLRMIPEVLRANVIHCHQQHVVASSVAAIVGRLGGRRVFVSDLGGGGWDVSAYVSTDGVYHGHLHISEYSRRISGHTEKAWAHVIYGGVDLGKFHPAPRQPAVQRPAVYVGRLLPHKGLNDLINAVTPQMPVELIGRPYDEPFLRDLRQMATGKRVAFRFDCNDDDIVAAYQQALCVVLPSVYRSMYGSESKVPELLGQTLLEGMACGSPAICTDVASMPEIVEDGVTGFIVPPNDPSSLQAKLTWLADHPELAERMGAAGRKRALEHFTWDKVVERCLDIYRGDSAPSIETWTSPIRRNQKLDECSKPSLPARSSTKSA